MTDKEKKFEEKQRKKDEKKLAKEEKKRAKEEKKRQKQLEREQKIQDIVDEEKKEKEELERMRRGKKGDSDDKSSEKKKKKFSFFGRKKKSEDEGDTAKDEKKKDTSEVSDEHSQESKEDASSDPEIPEEKKDSAQADNVEEGSDGSEEDADGEPQDKKSSRKAEKERKKREKREKKEQKKKDKKSKQKNKDRKGKLSPGEKILPHEEEEETNPKIRVYNDIVRHAYDHSEEPFSREGVSDDELSMIFRYVLGDYPELFWMSGYSYTPISIKHNFRCKDANGVLDIAQIKKKTAEMRKGAKFFTKGITKKTDPFDAALTIYRRLILTLDYDGVGLNARIDLDQSRDDALRSLYNAIVNHKVVCAGYAVAMQYLLQSVGIVCGYVISEDISDGSCHAFNILKLGKYCYYLDATWGDSSNTLNEENSDMISYDYFCVPFDEFIRAPRGQEPLHHPRAAFYPTLERFNYTNHEYYRYHNAYLRSYDENELIRIVSETAIRYDEDEMGEFSVGIRCASPSLMTHVTDMLLSKGKLRTIISRAKEETEKQKKKKAAKWLDLDCKGIIPNKDTGVMTLVFDVPPKKKNKKEKK